MQVGDVIESYAIRISPTDPIGGVIQAIGIAEGIVKVFILYLVIRMLMLSIKLLKKKLNE